MCMDGVRHPHTLHLQWIESKNKEEKYKQRTLQIQLKHALEEH